MVILQVYRFGTKLNLHICCSKTVLNTAKDDNLQSGILNMSSIDEDFELLPLKQQSSIEMSSTTVTYEHAIDIPDEIKAFDNINFFPMNLSNT